MAGVRLGLVDDHRAISAGVPVGLATQLTLDGPVVQARTVTELESATEGPFDVVILDVRLDDGSDPADNVRRLCARGWSVLLYTNEVSASVLAQCLSAGARGVVGKHEDWPVLAEAVLTAAGGDDFCNPEWAIAVDALAAAGRIPSLSEREVQVVKLYAAGLPAKSVARRLGIAEDTVKEFLRRIRRKYAAAGRPAATKAELTLRAVEDGHVRPGVE